MDGDAENAKTRGTTGRRPLDDETRSLFDRGLSEFEAERRRAGDAPALTDETTREALRELGYAE